MPVINRGFDYQEESIADVVKAWQAGYQNVCLVAPTGAGKTIIKALVAKLYNQQFPNNNIVIFAHRDVLLSQISLATAKVGLPHRMICSRATERQIAQVHMEELGESYLHGSSRIIVASVPTWVRRDMTTMAPHIGLWLMDETHHTVRDNMWGRTVMELSHALGLGVTATPVRADGKGLGRHASGVFDTIVKTPGMGELIRRGKLSPYKVFTVPTKVNVSNIKITSGGDYNQIELAEATDKAEITGDAVQHYVRLAAGKQGIIFGASVEHCEHIAEDFRKAGFNAVALSSKTPILERQHKVNDFKRGRIQLLVNYDLFGEGFDVPAVEVVIMLRKTLSYGLFKQMFGRCLRVFDGKEYGILIDHVQNVQEHCIPGKHLHEDPEWTLDDAKKRNQSDDDDEPKGRVCPECFHFYFPKAWNFNDFICPDCGHQETKAERVAAAREIQTKDGLLMEWDTGFLDSVLRERDKVDMSVDQFRNFTKNLPQVAQNGAIKRHIARQEAQQLLRPKIGEWCESYATTHGLDVETTQREFERKFGVNIFKAQTLSNTDSMQLLQKLDKAVIS